MKCELCNYPDGTHGDWCPQGINEENQQLREQLKKTFKVIETERAENVELRRQVNALNETIDHMNFQLGEACLKIAEYERKPLEEVKAWSDGLKQGVLNKLTALEAELAGMTKARDTFYNDMLMYKQACNDLVEFRETLFGAVKKRDRQIKALKISVQDREARADYSANCAKQLSEKLADRDARILVLEVAIESYFGPLCYNCKSKECHCCHVTPLKQVLNGSGKESD